MFMLRPQSHLNILLSSELMIDFIATSELKCSCFCLQQQVFHCIAFSASDGDYLHIAAGEAYNKVAALNHHSLHHRPYCTSTGDLRQEHAHPPQECTKSQLSLVS